MQTRSLTIFLVIMFGAAAVLWGCSQMLWPEMQLFASDSLPRNAIFLVAGAVILGELASSLKVNQLATSGVVAVAITVFTGTIWLLIVTIRFSLASYVLGMSTLSLLKIYKEKLPGITAGIVWGVVLTYLTYGKELGAFLTGLGFEVEYGRKDYESLGIMNTELFYCRKGNALGSEGVVNVC